MEENEIEENKDQTCTRCGLRSYEEECPSCGTPFIDKKDEEDEEYDWRETKR